MSRHAIRNVHRRQNTGQPLRSFVRSVLRMDLPDPEKHPLAHAEATRMFDWAASWAIAKGWTPIAHR